MLGFQFSFSLVNLLDPDAPIQVPLLSQMFSLMGTMILLASGLHRDILLAFLRSYHQWIHGLELNGYRVDSPDVMLAAVAPFTITRHLPAEVFSKLLRMYTKAAEPED